METKNTGLRGAEIADTRISNIDGENGRLIYRGHDIMDLVRNSSFEETAYLLLYDDLPNKAQMRRFASKTANGRRGGGATPYTRRPGRVPGPSGGSLFK